MVPGLLFSVIVEKGSDSIFVSEKKEVIKILKDNNLGEWKPSVVEKLLRICNISAYLVSLLIATSQKVFWMTDNDAIAANKNLATAWLTIFNQLLSILSRHELSNVEGAVPFKERNLLTLDLLSSADVVAGSLEHYFTRLSGGFEDFKEEANKVLEWLCYDGLLLKKQNIRIVRSESGIVKAGTIEFAPTEPDPKKITIPVYRP